MLEEKILNLEFYKKHKEKIREVYKKQKIDVKQRIKKAIYSSTLSKIKKDEIWNYLNQPKEFYICK